MIDIFIGEFIGTALLILLGNGAVANVLLQQTIGALVYQLFLRRT